MKSMLFEPWVQSSVKWRRGQCCVWPKQVNLKKKVFFLHFFSGNVFRVLRECQKFKFSKRKMILSASETSFLKCLYWKLSDTQMDNDCSNLVNKLLLSIIFLVITQNYLRDYIRGILRIDIHVSYSLSMPETAIIVVIG